MEAAEAHRQEEAPPVSAREWSLPLAFTRPLSLNDRMGWREKHGITKGWRAHAKSRARAARIPQLERFTAVLHYQPKSNRRRDTDNLVASLKPLVDGLRDAGVCVDDDTRHYTMTEPVIHGAVKGEPGRLWLVVIDLGHLPGTQTALDIPATKEIP